MPSLAFPAGRATAAIAVVLALSLSVAWSTLGTATLQIPLLAPGPPALSGPDEIARIELLGGTQQGEDGISGVAVSPNGSAVYVVGHTNIEDAETTENVLFRMKPGGGIEWRVVLPDDELTAIHNVAAVQGAVYIVGETRDAGFNGQPSSGKTDLFVTRYTDAGKLEWTRLLGGSKREFGHGVAIGANGDVFVVGATTSPEVAGERSPGKGITAMIARFSSAGELGWVRLLGGDGPDVARDVVVDARGVFVAGFTGSDRLDGKVNAGEKDLFVTRYGLDGKQEWLELVGKPKCEMGGAIAFMDDGSLVVAGKSNANTFRSAEGNGKLDALVVNMTARGEIVWTRLVGGDDMDGAEDVAVSGDTIYVVGQAKSSQVDDTKTDDDPPNALLTMLDRDGNVARVLLLGGSQGDAFSSVAADRDRAVYIGGRTSSNSFDDAANPRSLGMVFVRLR